LDISVVELASTTASLVLKGSLSADQTLDVTATARALPTDGSTTRAGGVEIGTLVFDASARGPLRSPNIAGQFRAADIVSSQARIGQAQATLSVDPLPASGDPNAPTRFAVSAQAHAEGIVSTGSALARAVGSRADLALKGEWGSNGEGTAETLRLTSPTLDLGYQGGLGTRTIDGTLQAKAPDLSVFSDLAGRMLRGNLDLSARLSGRLDRTIGADIDANAGNLAVGQAIADGLLGGRLTLKGHVERPQDGWSFSDFRAEGSSVSLVLNGSATERSADLFADLSLADLSKLDPRLAGRAGAKAHLTGSLAHPDLDATVTSGEGMRLLERPVRDLTLNVKGSDLLDRLDAAFDLRGTIGRNALTGQGRLRRPADDWILDGLQLRVGSAEIAGSAAIAPGGLAEGSLTIRAPDLDDLSPLVLTKLSGDLSAHLDLSRENGRQNVHLEARGRSLRAADIALSDLDANVDIRDLYARIVVDGRINADRLTAFGQTFDRIRASATGTPSASDVTLSAQAKGFDLSAAARILPQDQGIRIDLNTLRADRGGRTLSLPQPASVTIMDGAATIRDLSIAAEGGRITLSGRAGDTLDLSVGISRLPLSVAEIVQPGLGLSGTADGEATITGSSAAPQGRYRLRLDRVVLPATRSAGLPPVGLQASGTLVGDALTIDADLRAGPGIQLRAYGRVPFRAGASLDLRVTGTVDAGLANSFLGATGQRVGGQVRVDAKLGGTLADPRVEGSATLANGSFTDALRGIRLTNIRGRISGRGDRINIETLTAVTRNGGPITVSGSVETAPERGWPGQLRVVANRAELVSNDLATAVADLDLVVSGPLIEKPSIAGQVRIVSLDVSIPDQLPANVKPLPGIRHVDPPPAVRARRAARAKAERQAARAGPAFDATLDVAISAPRRIFVRGRGVDAELGGDLRLTGSMGLPDAVGAFDLRRGRLTLVGQRIDLTRGRLTFAGDLTPTIDLVAETSAGDVTARIVVTGPANQPSFDITSEPALPQDEVLSRLLFQKASGSLSAFQALQLAQAVSQLSGGAAGLDVFEGARRSLGLDSLDVTTGSKGGVAIGASRYISDRISVGVRAGAREEDTAATINIDVTRRLRVQGEVGADGRSSLGIGTEWEY
jgi:translocation and assembly module TamB